MPGEFVIPIVAIVMFHVTAITFLFLYFSTRHKERMALLEYDRDISVFRGDRIRGSGLLKWGLVLGFCGLGLLSGYLIETVFNVNEEIAYFSTLMIGAGAGLLVFYRIMQQKARSPQSVL